jgi:enoyl-[acyl-carrier protein] reductase I
MLDLSGKTALVTGIANDRSIAWGIAQQLHQAGAKLGVTYLPDDRDRGKQKVTKLVQDLSPSFILPCDVQDDAQIDAMYAEIGKAWEKIDILVHCLAFAKKDELAGDFSNTSRDGFQTGAGCECLFADPAMSGRKANDE